MTDAPNPPLLRTKLHVPRSRPGAVARPHLTARLDSATPRVALITAPPGFGKTTILTEWVATRGASAAWLSLDESDDDPRTFWRYVLAALATATGDAVEAAAALERPETSLDVVLTILVNDLDLGAGDVVLVLDDFHVIEDPAILAGVEFLIENAPPNLRIAVASRSDPALPLARLRASGELAELRAEDLRFTVDEVAAYFRRAGDALDSSAVTALWERTEGWIAAIQLASISLDGRPDAADFVGSFAGDHRHVVDYLLEEVLRRQPEHVRRFLLDTSILTRFTGEIVESVTTTPAGAVMLDDLDRRNLFLVPLDAQRRWFRYHHLFAQMLQVRLIAESPERVTTLHRRASDAYEGAGFVEEAIHHALAARDFGRARELIAVAAPALRRRRDEATLVRWLETLPADIVHADPELSLELAGALLSVGRVDDVEGLLERAARGERTEQSRSIRGGVALYRAAQALAAGDIDDALEQAGTAADLAAKDDHLSRGSATGIVALAHWSQGDLVTAEESWIEAVSALRRAGHLADTLGGVIALTDIAMAQGRLSHAHALASEALEAARATDPPLRGSADMLVVLADVLRERNDLVGADQRLSAARDLGADVGLPQNAHRLRAARARTQLAQGDFAAAIASFDEALRVFTPDFFPDHHPLAAQRARAHLSAGRLQDARDWARERGITEDDEPTYLSEFEHLTLARIWLADTDHAQRAERMLTRMLAAAEARGARGSAIEIRILLALALSTAGRTDAALDMVAAAVRDAAPEGYVRVFADEGDPIARLLGRLSTRSPHDVYVRQLVDAATTRAVGAGATPVLASPLSERELEVLRLLRSDLGGADIARRLFISLHTMRSHTKSIYAKLGVTSRRTAVTRASELGLLP